MRSLMCLLALALVIPIACGGGGQTQGDGAQIDDGSGQAIPIPEWAINIPGGDGAFYGVGSASFQSPTMYQHAVDSAAHAARNQLAATIRATIRSVSQRYSEQVLTAEGDVAEEGLSREVSEQVVDNLDISGARIRQMSEPFYHEPSGMNILFVKVGMDLDDVAESTANEMARRVDAVRDRADSAFDELRSMTEEEAPNHTPQEPERGDDNVPPDIAKSG